MKLIMLLLGLSLAAHTATAGELTVRVGPPALGGGGTNPVSIPPINPAEYDITYITDSGFESSFSIVPGFLFGQRTKLTDIFYFGGGGGLVISINGTGFGPYAEIGFSVGESVKFNMEFKQAIAYSSTIKSLVSPYALRAGVSFTL